MKVAYPEESEFKYSPERTLLVAILESAVRDLSESGVRRATAIRWFQGASARVTFAEVDEILSLKAAYKKKIRQYIKGTAFLKKGCKIGSLRVHRDRVRE